jgi:S-adenosylmethionine hydrolase
MKLRTHHFSFWGFAFVSVATSLIIGCFAFAPKEKPSDEIRGQIIEIDDHGNAVTDIKPPRFEALGWKLGDTLIATFSNGQKIELKYAADYGDVPNGAYLGRFSTRRGIFKIAINEGKLAEALKLEAPGEVVLRQILSSQ